MFAGHVRISILLNRKQCAIRHFNSLTSWDPLFPKHRQYLFPEHSDSIVTPPPPSPPHIYTPSHLQGVQFTRLLDSLTIYENTANFRLQFQQSFQKKKLLGHKGYDSKIVKLRFLQDKFFSPVLQICSAHKSISQKLHQSSQRVF